MYESYLSLLNRKIHKQAFYANLIIVGTIALAFLTNIPILIKILVIAILIPLIMFLCMLRVDKISNSYF